jgi:hypothetical protein
LRAGRERQPHGIDDVVAVEVGLLVQRDDERLAGFDEAGREDRLNGFGKRAGRRPGGAERNQFVGEALALFERDRLVDRVRRRRLGDDRHVARRRARRQRGHAIGPFDHRRRVEGQAIAADARIVGVAGRGAGLVDELVGDGLAGRIFRDFGGEVGLARNEGRPQRRRLQRGAGGAGAGMIVEQAHERAADENRPGGRGNAGGQQPARVLRLLFKRVFVETVGIDGVSTGGSPAVPDQSTGFAHEPIEQWLYPLLRASPPRRKSPTAPLFRRGG